MCIQHAYQRRFIEHLLPAIVVPLLAACGFSLAVSPGRAVARSEGIQVQNGWYSQDGRVRWGTIQHNGWWRAGQRPNLTRRAPVDGRIDNFANLDVRPNRTESLDGLTDNMNRYGYPGFEHNYGLWFDLTGDFDGSGTLRQLRLDPVAAGHGGLVTIDSIRILTPAVVPEPASALLLGLAGTFLLLAGMLKINRST